MNFEQHERAKRYITRAAQSLLAGTIAFGTLFAPFASPARAGEITPFNLNADADQNGIADELEAAVSGMSTLAQQGSEEEMLAAIKDFDLRLPYSAETRAAQAEIEKLQAELDSADEKRAEEIKQQIAALDETMKQDPAYVQTTEDLQVLLTPEEQKDDNPNFSAVGGHWNYAQVGDVLLHFDYWSISYLYAMNYGHTGQLVATNAVLESLPQGVVVRNVSNWQEGAKRTAIARNRYASPSSVVNATFARRDRHAFRTPYNYIIPNKWRDDALYCSQLTWKIQGDVGYNVDSNDFWYHLFLASRYGAWIVPFVAVPGVLPDEIARSPYIRIVATGWN